MDKTVLNDEELKSVAGGEMDFDKSARVREKAEAINAILGSLNGTILRLMPGAGLYIGLAVMFYAQPQTAVPNAKKALDEIEGAIEKCTDCKEKLTNLKQLVSDLINIIEG